jgi:hypothetical protein
MNFLNEKKTDLHIKQNWMDRFFKVKLIHIPKELTAQNARSVNHDWQGADKRSLYN